MSRRDATSRSLRRRPSRTVPAVLVAVVLLAVGVLTAVAAVSRLVEGRWPAQVTGAASAVTGLTWGAAPVLVVGAVLALVGLLLLVAGVTPGAPTAAPLASGGPSASVDETDFVISTRSLARLAAAGADQVDGVDGVAASASGRRVHLRVTTTSEKTTDIRQNVRDAVTARLTAAGVRPVPQVSATVRTKGNLMRQSAARLNRAWLVVLGLLLLLAGLLVLLTGAGLLRPAASTVGLDLQRPAPSDGLVGAGAGTALDVGWVVVLLAVAGVVLALAGLAWLVAQVPRANPAKPFRLSDSPADGLTVCAPDVLTDAVEAQVKALPDVTDASAVLRGSLAAPELTVKVTTGDRADIPALLDTLKNRVAADLGGALDTRLHRLGVQVEVGASRSKAHQVVL